ncbi:MAG: DUF7507 domain-containing protein [Nocardioides sp.]
MPTLRRIRAAVRDSLTAPLRPVLGLVLVAGALVTLTSAPASADPAGNNGTVKIAELGDIDSPSNDPHVGCTFRVEWYGFDQGPSIVSTVQFESWAPTADAVLNVDGPSSVFVGEDDNSGGGSAAGLDASVVYTLHFTGDPHPQQGYHVKLTIHTPGSIGNDTKSKVFWVQGCSPTVPSSPGLALHKSVTDAGGDGVGTLGELLTYHFTVTNTGNVPLTDVRITDATIPGLEAGQPCVAALAVGASTTCPLLPPVTHVVTADDVSAGAVANTATASGTTPDGGTVADDDMAVIPTVAPEPLAAGLSIDKSVDAGQAGPGDVVTYTLTVRNSGPGDAAGVVVTDPLPAAVTFVSASSPCTYAAPTVSCSLGTVAAGETRTLTVRARVNGVSGAGSDTQQHQLDYTKVESHLSVLGGDTGTVTATCPSGYLATDGSVRIDAVDQGAGTFADVVVLASTSTADGRGWTGTLRNDSGGQVQAKVEVVCASARTVSGEDHTHPLVVSAPVTTTTTVAAGRTAVDLTCPTGTWAITPGFQLTAGDASVGTRRTATGWRFLVDADAPATGTYEVRCLSTTLGAAQGHTHDLTFLELTGSVDVPAGQVVERSLTCPDGYKGIVAWADLPPGLQSLGNDPMPVTRSYRFSNETGGTLTATYGLLCASIRTTPSSTTAIGGDVTNRATVSTTSPDATTSDDTDTATFHVNVSSGIVLAPVASVSHRAGRTLVGVPVTASRSTVATARLLATRSVAGTGLRSGSVLAVASTRLRVGQHTVSLDATDAAARALVDGRVTRARLVVVTRSGQREVRVVRLRH